MPNSNVTPLKAIRLKCLDCSCRQPKEVRICLHDKCSLYPYRLGNNPKRRRIGQKMAIFQHKCPLNEGK